MSDANEQAQALQARPPGDVAQGSALGSLTYRLTPEQEAAQRAAQKAALANMAKQEAIYEAREARERADVQSRLDRETRQAAVHAALMIEAERATADDVLTNAAKFAAFLSGS